MNNYLKITLCGIEPRSMPKC